MKSTLLALALTSIASAQSTISLYIPGAEEFQGGIAASIVKSDSAAVTYSMTCASANATGEACPFPPSLLLTQGPATYHINFQSTQAIDGITLTVSADVACSITDSKSGVCSTTAQGNSGTSTYSSAETTAITDAPKELSLTAVTLLSGSPTSTGASSGAASQTGVPTTSASTGSAPKSSGASSTGGSPASASSSSTAGMPMITGNAQWVLGGAAAAIALGAM
ncbi:hypothetical protein HYALB_00000073 [Hymenoscyphus albidus]|uniref:GPI anchored cell wall protein n=1 Tax=Hymenoscyphus albidus TaxID=595503 RepID=A0A9N9LKS9_9HELO|nr:hypothetical protein HYALB_00000073 [Hymenoscyphus albidus]